MTLNVDARINIPPGSMCMEKDLVKQGRQVLYTELNRSHQERLRQFMSILKEIKLKEIKLD